MTFAKIKDNPIVRDFLFMLLFGTLSYALTFVTFNVQNSGSIENDFVAVPLLISLFYISNPLFIIGITAIMSLGYLSADSFLTVFIAQSISLIISKYVYNFIKTYRVNITTQGIIWVFYTVLYYVILLIPLLIIVISIKGVNIEISLPSYYLHFIHSARVEIIGTTLITAMYLVQFRVKQELKEHKNNLELLVKFRTEELETSNEELFEKNEIVNDQNSELKDTLNHLKDTQSQLLQSEKMASLGVLTAGVTHEINNPLNYIMGGYSGLSLYFEDNNIHDKDIDLLLSSIKTGTDRAIDIINGLSQFSRSDDLLNESCDIHFIINNCLLMLKNQMPERIKVNLNFTDETIQTQGNISKLHQVFISIVTNSIQFIDNKGTISINTKKQDKNIIVEIKDTGIGISQDNLSKITEPFFTTKDPGEGTGLGLSITYTIIREHRGTINFESELTKGTTATITLPLYD